MSLEALIAQLHGAHGVRAKQDIQRVAAALIGASAGVHNGDDAAAIPDGDGYTLLAAEGMLPSFVAADPWFAGYCAVMVNVSDVLAMGGRPLAVVDVLFAGDGEQPAEALRGMRDAALAFGVPVVGGHTGKISSEGSYLAAAIVGRARKLITSFDARPGDELIALFDLRGAYRGSAPYFDAATRRSSDSLRALLALLPELAEAELTCAGKDVSMAGVVGTLTMLCEGSGVGASLSLDALPRPHGVELGRWLTTFPSFGFLLAVPARHASEVHARCRRLGVESARVGAFTEAQQIELRLGDERGQFWDLREQPFTGFGRPDVEVTP